MSQIRLGLIGDNIAASSAPRLHELVGRMMGLPISYRRLVPREESLSAPALMERCRTEGYRGLNITYPHKETIAALVTVPDPAVRALGAVNTVLFEPDAMIGHNTDHTGFIAAWHAAHGQETPGTTAMFGTGGVGRAVAFALHRLEAGAIRLFDTDAARAERLAGELRAVGARASAHGSAEEAAAGANGLVNATPLGMVGRPGTPLPAPAMRHARGGWAFDAVYTPVDTPFLRDAAASGLRTITGWELFFWQGVHAARLFTGREPDVARLRAALLEGVA